MAKSRSTKPKQEPGTADRLARTPWVSRGLRVVSELVIAAALLSALAPWLWLGAVSLRLAPWLALLLFVSLVINRRHTWHAVASVVALMVLAWPTFDVFYQQTPAASLEEIDQQHIRIVTADLRRWQGDEDGLEILAQALSATQAHIAVVVVHDHADLVEMVDDLPGYPFEVTQPIASLEPPADREDERERSGWLCILSQRAIGGWTNHYFTDGTALAGSGLITWGDGPDLRLVTAVPPLLGDPRGFPGRKELTQRVIAELTSDQPAVLVVPCGWSATDANFRMLTSQAQLDLAGGQSAATGATWLPWPWRSRDSTVAVRGVAAARPELVDLPGHYRSAALWLIALPPQLTD